jgi:hypothetical protein
LIDLLAQHRAQVAGFGAKNLLPDRLVPEKGQSIGGKLPTTSQLTADRRNEDEWK